MNVLSNLIKVKVFDQTTTLHVASHSRQVVQTSAKLCKVLTSAKYFYILSWWTSARATGGWWSPRAGRAPGDWATTRPPTTTTPRPTAGGTTATTTRTLQSPCCCCCCLTTRAVNKTVKFHCALRRTLLDPSPC